MGMRQFGPTAYGGTRPYGDSDIAISIDDKTVYYLGPTGTVNKSIHLIDVFIGSAYELTPEQFFYKEHWDKIPGYKKEENGTGTKCHCSMDDLMNFGCKCGGV